MGLGLSLEGISIELGDGELVATNPRARTRLSASGRYSLRTCAMIWAAGAVVSWALAGGVIMGAIAVGHVAFG
jgi:hypothetical protein